MSELCWSFEELVRFTEGDDPEVRYWAIHRLTRHFPETCSDVIHTFLLDDHDDTPKRVARHLAEHGTEKHHTTLLKGFRLLRGLTPGLCLRALSRTGYPGVVEVARDGLKRGDLRDDALALIVEALSELGTPEAQEAVREYIERKVELLVEPPALRGVLRVLRSEELPGMLRRLLSTMSWKGSHRAGEAFRILMDELCIDDAAWCFRTGPAGPIEIRKTIKAVESGYDCDILAAMGEAAITRIAQRFRAGNIREISRELAGWTAHATDSMRVDADSVLPQRIAATVTALSEPAALDEAERLGHQFLQWLLGFQLSAAFAVARYQSREFTLGEARGSLESLLKLGEVETAFNLQELPTEILRACGDARELRDRAQDWCLRMLEAQGPFFPKVVALETLGELNAVHFIPEIMQYLSEENSYVYGAAERALSRMGEAIVQPASNRIEVDQLDPDAAHSILVLLCDLGSVAAFELVTRNLDWFMEFVGPGTTADWLSLFGAEETIDPLRDWLDQHPPLVGQALLLLGAIHGVRIPEEDEIIRAIEDERARQAAEEGEDVLLTPDTDGDYVM